MSPLASCSVTVSDDFETVTPAVSSSVIVTVTVHLDPQELPDASTSGVCWVPIRYSISRSKVSSSSSSASFVIVIANDSSTFHTPPVKLN